ncbi:MAG: hypothetical protein U0821_23635 [Chloroflexota bacterium]
MTTPRDRSLGDGNRSSARRRFFRILFLACAAIVSPIYGSLAGGTTTGAQTADLAPIESAVLTSYYGRIPQGIAVDAAVDRVFLTGVEPPTITALRMSSLSPAGSLAWGYAPGAIAADTRRHRIAVVNGGGVISRTSIDLVQAADFTTTSVSLLDAVTLSPVAVRRAGMHAGGESLVENATGIMWDQVGGRFFLTDQGRVDVVPPNVAGLPPTLRVFDADSFEQIAVDPPDPVVGMAAVLEPRLVRWHHAFAVDGALERVYQLAVTSSLVLLERDARDLTIVATTPLPGLTTAGGRWHRMSVDLNTHRMVISTLGPSSGPWLLSFDPSSRTWLSMQSPSPALTRSEQIGINLHPLAVDSAAGVAYVASAISHELLAYDTRSLCPLGQVKLEGIPRMIAVDEVNHRVFTVTSSEQPATRGFPVLTSFEGIATSESTIPAGPCGEPWTPGG